MPLSTTTLPAQARRVLLCTNPKAGAGGRGELAQSLARRLSEAGYQAEVICDLDRVAAEANRLQAAGELRALVSLGGDGTAAELVNRTMPGVPVAVFPVGTENLLARHLGMEANAESLCHAIASGEVLQADAGRANGRIFLLMLGCGFDAEVVHQLSATRTGHIRRWTYAKPILAAARSYRYPSVRVTEPPPGGDQLAASHEACWAFLFNLPCYAGGLGLAPHADGGDGALDLCTFARGSFWHGLWYLGGVLTGMHRRMPDFKTRPVQRVRLEADERVPYQLDGDPGGCLPVEVETLPGRLTLFASPARLAALRCPAAHGQSA
ncbi:MAG: diacylglycerol kinase family protein [Pirellulales bacterium]